MHTRAARNRRRRIALIGMAFVGGALLLFAASPALGVGPEISVSPKTTRPGGSITVTGTDHPQACDMDDLTDIRLVWDSSLVLSQPINVKSDGSFSEVVTVPSNAAVGPHQIASTCTASPPSAGSLKAALATATVEVTAAPTPPKGTSATGNSPASSQGETRVLPGRITRAQPPGDDFVVRQQAPVPPAGESVTNNDTTDAGSAAEQTAGAGRSPFPISLNSPSESLKDPATLVKSVAVAGFALVLLGFPAELFNSTLEAHYEEISGWLRRPQSALNRLRRWTSRIPKSLIFAIFAALGGLIYAFLDPSLGWDRKSAALIIGLMISIAVVTLAVELPILLYARRLGAGGYLSAFPQALFLGVLCVVASRWLRFQPGYVYGITYGYKPTNCEPSDRRIGKATAVGGAILLWTSLIAWIVWGPVDKAASRPGASLGLLIGDAVLAGIVIAGIQGLVFGLLPLRFCDGYKVAAWSRKIWVGLWAISILAFVQIILTPRGGFLSSSGDSLRKMLGLFIGFGVLSVAFWAYFRFRWPRAIPDETWKGELGLAKKHLEKVRTD